MKNKKKLDAIKQSRPRTPLPRPATFADKTKYNRRHVKAAVRKEAEGR